MSAPPSYEFIFEDEPRQGQLQKILAPVKKHVVDPVARAWAFTNSTVDRYISKAMNPLLFKRLFFLLTVTLVFCFTYTGSLGRSSKSFLSNQHFQSQLKDLVSIERIKHTTDYFNSLPHVAGTVGSHATAKYVYDSLTSYGVERAEISPQDVMITHRQSASLVVKTQDGEFEASLAEGSFLGDQQPVPHMALGTSGKANGKLVYVNFGSREDLDWLIRSGIHIKNKIVLVRYGEGNPGMTARRIEEYGAAGIIYFSYKQPGVPAWPDGPDYGEETVQRACVATPQLWPGDPLSPGWSSSHAMTVSLDNVQALVKIPTTSISWKEVGPILAALKSHGQQVGDWHNNGYPKQVDEWWTGDQSEASPEATIELDIAEEDRHTVYNVLARIPGIEQQEDAVMIGASLDSFCGGGVKLSGVAVLLEVAKALSYLAFDKKWQPLRSIYFFVWDGSTQNFAGATEWMESLSPRLMQSGVLYIDLDKGVSGQDLWVQGNPSIDIRSLVAEIDSSLVVDAEGREIPWDFGTNDVFSSYVGVPSISLGMTSKDGVYPKDSCLDSAEWQDKFGDADYQGHKKLADVASRLLYEFADNPMLPFNYSYFVENCNTYVNDLEDYVGSRLGPSKKSQFEDQFSNIRDALGYTATAGERSTIWDANWHKAMKNPVENGESLILTQLRVDWNNRLNDFNKRLLHRGGIYHRDWFKNLIFGPKYEASAKDQYSGTFPGVRDLVWMNQVDAIKEGLQQVSDAIHDASQYLLDAPYWG